MGHHRLVRAIARDQLLKELLISLYTVSCGSRLYQVNIEGSQATVNGEPVKATFQTLNRHGLHLWLQDEETLQVLVSGQRSDVHVANTFRRKTGRSQECYNG